MDRTYQAFYLNTKATRGWAVADPVLDGIQYIIYADDSMIALVDGKKVAIGLDPSWLHCLMWNVGTLDV